MSEARYLVGIDLGTSNCAMAYIDPAGGEDAPLRDFPIPQLVRPAEVAVLSVLPSCVYLAGAHELPPESTQLPWHSEPDRIVGEFARWQGARVPSRLVASAKSWLCHPGVDRSAAILPWGAGGDVPRISPVTASAQLLSHMARAWNNANPATPLSTQEVIITVPASFDEAARALTVQAAHQAGLERFTLLEEPQAAFYDFTARHRRDLGSVLEDTRLILVVDVGGGTSDFTLVQVGVGPEGPVLRRIAVGEHLMLGGDNMDAALSRVVEEQMLGAGRKLSMVQWTQLTQVARLAKEQLLSARSRPGGKGRRGGQKSEDSFTLSVASEGSQLVGGTLRAQVSRAEVEGVVLDGFFPACDPEAIAQRSARVALQEVGLPYAKDPAITRHLVAFLRAHAPAARAALGQIDNAARLPRPDAILLNGGVFNSSVITRKLLEVVSSWWPQAPPVALLKHDSLDLAVARGAAFYGLARRGLVGRIGGGAAHALFVGLEKADTKEPMALCVIPRGQEEGETIELGQRTFQLALGKPVRFPLFSTASDRLERAGDVVPVTEDLHALPPIHTLLRTRQGAGATASVHLRAMLTEIGTLELWCVSNKTSETWRLEFELRGNGAEPELIVTQAATASLSHARVWIERFFGGKAATLRAGQSETKSAAPREVKHLWSALEKTLGPREDWPLTALRELWSILMAGAARRRRSAEHERVFFQLLGYALRPGFGYPLDDWRCEESAKLFGEGVQFHHEKAVWKEFWVMWRRIAGGLSEARHQQIWTYLKPFLALRVSPRPPKHLVKPKGVQPEGTDEMARLAAGLEHLPWQEKAELGDWVATRVTEPALASGPWTWAIGRLGARAPIFGSIHQTVPPDRAAEWAARLLDAEVSRLEGALFALAQLARLTGDRTRDLDERTRSRVLDVFDKLDASPSWRRLVTEIVSLEAKDKARALGDTLPVGLSLV